jgi:uncharacterized protein YjbJ (UPF0337 family)
MNQDRCAGMWKQLTGSVKEHWGELTDNPFVALAGTRDRLAGRAQERYGVSKEQSARQFKASPTQPRLVRLESVKGEATPKRKERAGVSRSIGVGAFKWLQVVAESSMGARANWRKGDRVGMSSLNLPAVLMAHSGPRKTSLLRRTRLLAIEMICR